MRKRLFEIIEKSDGNDKLSTLYDYTMIVIITLSLIPLLFKHENAFFTVTDKVTAGIFIVDYLLRLATADYKFEKEGIKSFLRYPFSGMAIIDLLSILPSLTFVNSSLKVLRVVRMMRAMRVVRVFKAMRYSRSFEIIGNVIRMSKDSLVAVCALAAGYILISAIIIKIQSPGPIFFRQLRTGLDGKSFYCLKFRSMHVNKDADRLQATKDDPRKFSYGNIMRKTNIDELPQFINVLLGDMSVVGPRPHMLKHTEEYSNIINRYMVRHLAKPGITGLAQVSGFRGETQKLSQMEDRVKKDIEYIENWTLLLDIRIIVKTVTNVFAGEKNAY